MNPTTFFATIRSYIDGSERDAQTKLRASLPDCCTKLLRLLHLPEFELDRRRPPEDRHRHAQLRLVVVDVLDGAVKIGERAFAHPHRLADLEQHLGLGLLHALLHLL